MENNLVGTDSQPPLSARKSFRDEVHDIQKEWLEEERRVKAANKKRKMIDMIGGIEAYEKFRFETFRRNENHRPFDALMSFDPAKDNFYFYGKNQLGKTHLSTAVFLKFWELNGDAMFITMPDFIDEICIYESKFDYQGKKLFITKLIDAGVLIWDEWGLGALKTYVLAAIWQILEGRIKKGKKGLISTSNHTLDDLKVDYGGKIPHRIFEMCGEKNIIKFQPKIKVI